MRRSEDKIFIGILLTVLLWICCSCGYKKEAVDTEGRYREESVDLPVGFAGMALAQDGNTIRLFDAYGSDLLSVDAGNIFEAADPIPNAKKVGSVWITGLAGDVDGTRMFCADEAGEFTWELVTGEDKKILLEVPEGESSFFPVSIYGEGSFYSFHERRIYKTDGVTGDTSLLAETNDFIVSLATAGHVLYAVTMDGLSLFNSDSGERLAQQDELLGEYLGGKGLEPLSNAFPAILCPLGEEIYVLTHDGLYRHTLYEDTMELVLDSGVFSSIGNPDRDFVGMAVMEGDGKDIFLVLYSDGSLMRYVFDLELSAGADLRVYSVYEDVNMLRMINAYKEEHPGQTVVYEVGSKSDYGVALKDVLNNLSTEIAAGTGPDILVMDDVPYQAYADQGVLMDLSFLRDTMTDETYYTNVVDGFAVEKGLFAMPMAFVVPVIGADAEWMGQFEEAESLSDLADILEEARRSIPEGELIGFFQAEHTLSQLSEASMGAWMKEEGGIDTGALTEFLTQAKRIFDTEMEGAPEGMDKWYPDNPLETLDANRITRVFGEDISRAFGLKEDAVISGYGKLPFYTDYLRENFAKVNRYQEIYGAGIILLPGQKYGSCLPVTVLAVNQGTKHTKESMEFMEFMFSGEVQGNTELFGFPVSREAYRLKQIDTRPEGRRGAVGVIMRNGNPDYFYWPSEEAFQRLDDLLDRVTGVGICDSQVYDTVIRLGQTALTGESTIEEAVDAIEKELRIYLAE